MNRRSFRTIVQLVEILLETYYKAEVPRGKPLGLDAKNAIAKRLAEIFRVDIVTPIVLMATVDLRTLL